MVSQFEFMYNNNRLIRSIGIFAISTNFERKLHFKCFCQQLKLKRLSRTEVKNPQKEFKYCLTIVAITKDEAPYLMEWIEYYRLMGVDKFVLYNHDNRDNTLEVLQPYIEKGIVDYSFISTPNSRLHHPQSEVYTDAVIRYRSYTKWMAFIDIDEFIVPEGG